MSERYRNCSGYESPPDSLLEQVVELSLLLPAWQVSALEMAAHSRGLTAGQMVRSLLQEFLTREQGCDCRPVSCGAR